MKFNKIISIESLRMKVEKLLATVISFFFPLQAVRQVAVLLPVILPAATAPLERSRITVRRNLLRSPILYRRGLQRFVKGPLDSEWETKNNFQRRKYL